MKKYFLFAFLLGGSYLYAANDPLQKVAEDLASSLCRHPNKKVAVLTVPYNDHHRSDGPFFVSEKLANYLAKNKMLAVLERSHMAQILSELHLSESGVLDPKTAKQIGDILGADVVVTGTLIDLDDGKTEINVRGLFLSNGRIIAASRGELERTWKSRPVLKW